VQSHTETCVRSCRPQPCRPNTRRNGQPDSMSLPVTAREIESLLPHRPPMRWIDSLIECTETEARGRVSFAKDHFAVVNGQIAESALVECVAQTVAAALGYRSRGKGNTATANSG